MAEELQGLLNRINEEGIKKAETEKADIIKNAQKEAEDIVQGAKEEADSILKKASEDAKKNEERAKSSIKQAARDIIIELNSTLQERMRNCIKDLISEALTPELMGEIIKKMSEHYIETSGKEASMKLIFPQKELNEIVDKLKKSFLDSFEEKPEVFTGHDFATGMKIGFKGSDVFFDFSDEALTDIVCEYVGPRLASVIK
ncbi:MAG: hypothetical protein K9L78_01810 [Victivallales bacterium]|nr:hypothetical protein [Victivallales bacterium]MCF7888832.1 hypothetical protein [Victivallales bacterium]